MIKKINDKKASFHITMGFYIRVLAALVDVVSLPFLIINPANLFAQITFGFGNFLLIIGGVMD
jgi:hypothetical protein